MRRLSQQGLGGRILCGPTGDLAADPGEYDGIPRYEPHSPRVVCIRAPSAGRLDLGSAHPPGTALANINSAGSQMQQQSRARAVETRGHNHGPLAAVIGHCHLGAQDIRGGGWWRLLRRAASSGMPAGTCHPSRRTRRVVAPASDFPGFRVQVPPRTPKPGKFPLNQTSLEHAARPAGRRAAPALPAGRRP
jgi:hypothetical protein